MQRTVLKMIRYFLLVVCVVMFLLGVLSENISLLNYSVVLLFVNNILYAIEVFYKRIFFLAFQITFFTFLMGRTLSELFLTREDYYHFPNNILVHTEVCLFVALLSLYLGYILFTRVRFFKDESLDVIDYESNRYLSIRRISKCLFLLMLPFSMLVIIEKAIFVKVMGYASFYIDYVSKFPYVITKLADICPLLFYIFLATMPSKKEIKWPAVFFLLRAVCLMFTGKRADFVVPVLLLVLYFSRRNMIHSGGERWLTKKHLRVLAACIPILLFALFSYNTIRFGVSNKKSSSFIEGIFGFFENTGFSVNVISFEKLYEDRVPDKIYSFGDTSDYIRENIITQLFFDLPIYKTQTIDKALYGNNFSQTITYLRSPNYYLSGRGYGSSYIAEAYHDFGYWGIVFWSFIYSWMLASVYSFKGKGVIYITLALQALHYILLAPRNMASAFISEYINVDNWIVIGGLTFIVHVLLKRKYVRILCK